MITVATACSLFGFLISLLSNSCVDALPIVDDLPFADPNGVTDIILSQYPPHALEFNHFIFIEMTVTLGGINNDLYWNELEDRLRYSLYTNVGELCNDEDYAVQINAVKINPNEVEYADGLLSNIEDFNPAAVMRVNVPAMLEMSCSTCDPTEIVLMLGEPLDLGSPFRRDRERRLTKFQHPQQEKEQQEHDHRRRRGLMGLTRGEYETPSRYFCDAATSQDVALNFFELVLFNPSGFNIDPIQNIYSVADTTPDPDCLYNKTLNEFEYVLYFTATSPPRSNYTEEKLLMYGDLFKRVYNEANALNWKLCDSQSRIVTEAIFNLPPGEWEDGEIITFEVTFLGYCRGCNPEGCLIDFPEEEGWPVPVSFLRPEERSSDNSFWAPPQDPERVDRQQQPPSRESSNIRDSYARERINRNDENNNGRTSSGTTTTITRDSYARHEGHQPSELDRSSGRTARNYSNRRLGVKDNLNDHSHRRLQIMDESLGECMCNEYSIQGIPTLADFNDILYMAFSNLEEKPLIGLPTSMWDKAGTCNDCRCPPMEFTPITNSTKLAEAIEDYFSAEPAKPYGYPMTCWDVSQVQDFSNPFADVSFNEPIGCWDVSSGITFDSMFADHADFNYDLGSWNTSSAQTMASMFENAYAFNQNINSWDVSKVQDFSSMFYYAEQFDQPLDDWVTSSAISMSSMFEGAFNFCQNINSWDVSNVIFFGGMFYDASLFNQPLDAWVTSSAEDMESMFREASSFDQNINSWDVSRVPSLSSMFNGATVFNQPLDNWETSSVFSLGSVFSFAENFNQNINSWDTSKVTNINSAFYYADAFNQPLDLWNTSMVTSLFYVFEHAHSFNQNINSWEVGQVSFFFYTFANAWSFNQPLDMWDTSSAIFVPYMFQSSAFNHPIGMWDVTSVQFIEGMFDNATSFNQDLNDWVPGNVLNFLYMFRDTKSFNQPLADWRFIQADSFAEMFRGSIFNQPISSWPVATIREYQLMFADNPAFNQDLSRWSVSSGVNFFGMFQNAVSFNQPLTNWDTSNANDFGFMFDNSAFNQPVDHLDPSGVTYIDFMFRDCTEFNQPMDSWELSNALTFESMFENTALNQSLCHFNNSIDGSAFDLFSFPEPFLNMFKWTDCPTRNDPVLFEGPFCYPCA